MYVTGYNGGGGQEFNAGYAYNPTGYQPSPQQFAPQQYSQPGAPPTMPPFQHNPSAPPPQNNVPPFSNFAASQLINDPLIANAAVQYGQNLVGQGQDYIEKKLDKYMSVSKLKYYFAVDTQYVMRKIKLIFFPFTHSVSIVCFRDILNDV